MTQPNSHDPKKDDNTARFRAILTSKDDEEPPRQTPPKQTPPPTRPVADLLAHFPKKGEAAPKANPPKRGRSFQILKASAE